MVSLQALILTTLLFAQVIYAQTLSQSIKDYSGNLWTVVNEQVVLNGVVDTSTSNVKGLMYVPPTIWKLSNCGYWHSKTSTTDSWSSGILRPPVPGFAAGYFYNMKGQMYDPNGNQWFGRGVDIEDSVTDATPILNTLPGLNVVRCPCGSYQNSSYYDDVVNSFTSNGVVIILENHQNFWANGSSAGDAGGGQGNIFTGQILDTETNWYTDIANAFQGNPYVWFGTNNEPSTTDANGTSDPAALSLWQQTTYNAIRGTGNTAPILVEANCDQDYSQRVNPGMTPEVYQQFTNMAWDFHIYNWIFGMEDNYTFQNAGVQEIIYELQTDWTSQDGVPAVFCGEYGPSTEGTEPMDNGGMTLVSVVQDNTGNGLGLAGNCAWNYFLLCDICGGDAITDYNGNLTDPYGTTVAAWISSASENEKN